MAPALLALGTIGPIPVVKICAFLFVILPLLPSYNLSNPQAVPWSLLWVSPIWYAHVIAYGVVFLIGGLGYDSFFASRNASNGDSPTRRIRTSIHPVREHRIHAVMLGMYVMAACFIAGEYIYFSGLFSPDLQDRHKAIRERNRHAPGQSVLADPTVQSFLAGMISYLVIKQGVDLHLIGQEARTDQMEDNSPIPFENLAELPPNYHRASDASSVETDDDELLQIWWTTQPNEVRS
ncbi:hypothetical protein MMC07_002206 [Pseudocyphellaria aurata]|nr:hypothetical protein [Pseudocyphellaria aurata]